MNTCRTRASVAGGLGLPTAQDDVFSSPWLVGRGLTPLEWSSLPSKVTSWRDAHTLLLTMLNYSACNPALKQTFYSCSAHASLGRLWGGIPLFQNERRCFKTILLQNSGSLISQVRVKITDARAFLEGLFGGLGRAKEGSWWWFSIRELSQPRSQKPWCQVWCSRLRGDFIFIKKIFYWSIKVSNKSINYCCVILYKLQGYNIVIQNF